MVMVGRQASVISESGTHAEARAFSDDSGTRDRIPIVGAAFAYDCPLTSKTYLMILRNDIYVKKSLSTI